MHWPGTTRWEARSEDRPAESIQNAGLTINRSRPVGPIMVASRRTRALVDRLKASPDPSIRWRTHTRVHLRPTPDRYVRNLEAEIGRSSRVRRLLNQARVPHRRGTHGGIYRYWQGIHWALAALADIGYPAGRVELAPVLDRALEMWTGPRFEETVPESPQGVAGGRGVPLIQGRFRRCASQQGNAVLYASRLGPADARAQKLVEPLVRWQWPDGGWDCARSPGAHVSSFMETLTPMRGLASYARATRSSEARDAADRASEVSLQRGLFRRRRDRRVIKADFLRLHYPIYWHYDALNGLKGLAELGRIGDPRCAEALDWLESRELRHGGWPVDSRYYRVSPAYQLGCEYVDWGAPDPGRRNDWVTTDALQVLVAAGRISL